MIFENKEAIVEELFSNQFDILKKITDEFYRFITDYLDPGKKIDEKNYQINELEHQGDNIRRNIETNIEKGAFIPLYREDYITLSEMIDSILNRVQSTFLQIILTRLEFPSTIHKDLLALTKVSVEASNPISEIFQFLGEPIEKSKQMFDDIEQKEHDADMIERNLIREIFTLDIEYAHKLHLKELIERIASLSDLAEDVGDRMQIMVVKRTI